MRNLALLALTLFCAAAIALPVPGQPAPDGTYLIDDAVLGAGTCDLGPLVGGAGGGSGGNGATTLYPDLAFAWNATLGMYLITDAGVPVAFGTVRFGGDGGLGRVRMEYFDYDQSAPSFVGASLGETTYVLQED